MTFQTILSQGGPVMYVLLSMSILAVAIVLAKLIQFSRLGFGRFGFVDHAASLLKNANVDAAVNFLAQNRSPVAAVMSHAIELASDPSLSKADTEAELARAGSAKIRDVESWLRGLSAIAHLSPLLGLLGTVMGMIVAFMRIQNVGSQVDPAVLSGGIWEALLTTAFGLAIAIPAMAAYFYLEGQVDNMRAAMKDATVRVLVHFRKGGDPAVNLVSDVDQRLKGGEGYGV